MTDAPRRVSREEFRATFHRLREPVEVTVSGRHLAMFYPGGTIPEPMDWTPGDLLEDEDGAPLSEAIQQAHRRRVEEAVRVALRMRPFVTETSYTSVDARPVATPRPSTLDQQALDIRRARASITPAPKPVAKSKPGKVRSVRSPKGPVR